MIKVMHNAIAHYMLSDAQPDSKQSLPCFIVQHDVIWYWISLASLSPLSWFHSLPAFCAPPAFSLAEQQEKLKSP